MARPPLLRSTSAALASLLVAGIGVAAAGVASRSGGGSASPTPAGANATRFLTLTGAGAQPSAGGPARGAEGSKSRPAAPPAAPAAERCGKSPKTPAGWCIRPAGTQYQVFRFPIGLGIASDGKVVVSSDMGGMQGLSVIDPAAPPGSGAVATTPAANLFLGVAVTGDGKVYASGGNADRVFRFRLAGPAAVSQELTEAAFFPSHNATNGMQARFGQSPQALPAGDGIMVGGYPGALALDQPHHLLFVAGSLAETSGTGTEACPTGQPACARVTVVDTGTDKVVGRFAVGIDAYGLALGGDTLYVSNWGDQAGRGRGVGTVSVVALDPKTHVPTGESRFVAVGHHPSALQLNGASDKLFVADTNDDTVSVVDTSTYSVTHVPVGVRGAPVGTHPDAFALSPAPTHMLFVALAGLNAVQVLDATTGTPWGSRSPSGPPTYIPTGWYPAALSAVAGPGGATRLWVANAKGEGPGPGINGSVLSNGTESGGTVSRIDVDPGRFGTWTKEVVVNDGLTPALDACSPALSPSPAICPAGRSPIRHVVYIVAENKTFDQYFGDLKATMPDGGYDADPGYLVYGQPYTPNQHKMLADKVGGLDDNFFSDAEVSVNGHSYTSGAIATDHNEKTWPADYDNGVRGTHGGGDPLRPSTGSKVASSTIQQAEDVLNDPQAGYIFESFVRAGAVPPDKAGPGKLSMAIYGEHTLTVPYKDMAAYKAKWTKGDRTTVDWKAGDIQYFDTCRAGLFVSGKTTGGGSPDTDFSRDCEARQLDAPYVLKYWEDAYGGRVAGIPQGTDVMPNFIYMSLPVNHTLGTNLGSPTPASMVADNDYAIGYIVQELSKSPFWSSTAVIIVQDDTQAAGDHVSALRDPAEIVGPFARPGASHQRGSMPSVLRTIETIFSVSPVSLNDQLAVPLHDAFVSKLSDAHPAVYTAVKPVVPFALNQPGAPGQSASMAMDWSQYDRIDMGTLNAILWADARHTPFRGAGGGSTSGRT
jgi:YVTN family beta-propeller protein